MLDSSVVLYLPLVSLPLSVSRRKSNTNTTFKNVSMWATKEIFVQLCKWSRQCQFYEYCSNFQYFIPCLELYRTQIVCVCGSTIFLSVGQTYSECHHYIEAYIDSIQCRHSGWFCYCPSNFLSIFRLDPLISVLLPLTPTTSSYGSHAWCRWNTATVRQHT